ncbi:MAG TPA: hypothetical protein VHB73_02875, partial [Alphaproteobacteria bacterium]|nr:hypothetical protein [Alphaproteobacteria bacterium]
PAALNIVSRAQPLPSAPAPAPSSSFAIAATQVYAEVQEGRYSNGNGLKTKANGKTIRTGHANGVSGSMTIYGNPNRNHAAPKAKSDALAPYQVIQNAVSHMGRYDGETQALLKRWDELATSERYLFGELAAEGGEKSERTRLKAAIALAEAKLPNLVRNREALENRAQQKEKLVTKARQEEAACREQIREMTQEMARHNQLFAEHSSTLVRVKALREGLQPDILERLPASGTDEAPAKENFKQKKRKERRLRRAKKLQARVHDLSGRPKLRKRDSIIALTDSPAWLARLLMGEKKLQRQKAVQEARWGKRQTQIDSYNPEIAAETFIEVLSEKVSPLTVLPKRLDEPGLKQMMRDLGGWYEAEVAGVRLTLPANIRAVAIGPKKQAGQAYQAAQEAATDGIYAELDGTKVRGSWKGHKSTRRTSKAHLRDLAFD